MTSASLFVAMPNQRFHSNEVGRSGSYSKTTHCMTATFSVCLQKS